ncbi:MAG: hypothetical protein Q9161_008653 [Pseudevernia consocians]
MAAIAILMGLALLRYVSAQNNTTTLLLPDGLFNPSPYPQTFVGEMTVTGHATYYTLNCADSANTRFLLPTYNLGQDPFYNTDIVPTWLENFNQTRHVLKHNSLTVNCAPLNTNNTANCAWTSLYNNENANDKSIISSTIVTGSSTSPESSLYTVIFTVPGAAAAAATPLNPTASPTNTNPVAPKTTASDPPTSPSPSPSPSTATTNPPAAHAGLSPGSKAGIGVGVPLGVCALSGLALLFHLHRRHQRRSRLSQTENLMPYEVCSPVEFERKDNVAAAENGGVYEMPGRQSPVQSPELEA